MRRLLQAVLAIQRRNLVVLEVKSNLLREDARRAFQGFSPCYYGVSA